LSQQSNSKKNRVYIPTPEASISVPYFKDLYNRLVEAPPLQYIRVPGELFFLEGFTVELFILIATYSLYAAQEYAVPDAAQA